MLLGSTKPSHSSDPLEAGGKAVPISDLNVETDKGLRRQFSWKDKMEDLSSNLRSHTSQAQ